MVGDIGLFPPALSSRCENERRAPQCRHGYGVIDDAWQRPIVEVGPFGPDKGQGGKFLLLPPDHAGDAPEGYLPARSKTNLVMYLGRAFVKDGDVEAAVATLARLRVYRLHVPPNVPVEEFWSVTVYDNLTRSMIETDTMDAGVSSKRSPVINDDGSVDIDFGPTKPADAGNWVKTLPRRGWFAYFRWYGPTQAFFDKSWSLPDIEKWE